MTPLRHIAIVGLGSIGRRHLRLLNQLRPEIAVTLVRSGKGSRWPEEALATQTVPSIQQALDLGIQAAIISSPAPTHVPQAAELIRAGIPLLIEKPLSNRLSDAVQLSDLAQQANTLVLVGYVLRYAISALRFHELLSEGRLGVPLFARIESGSYLPDWRPEQDYRLTASARSELGGGVLLELSHELDYANWFFGPFHNMQAALRNSGTLGIDVEDTADLVLKAHDSLPVSIHLDFCRRHATRTCTIYGQEGSLTWDAIQNRISWLSAAGDDEHWDCAAERDAMFRSQLTHFLACVEQGETPKVSLSDGIDALALVEAARQSDREGNVVYL